MDNIKDLLRPLEIKKAPPRGQGSARRAPAYKWQELALEIVAALSDGANKKSSIFKCCKENSHYAKIAFEDCKELNKLHANYFLKVYNELKNPTIKK